MSRKLSIAFMLCVFSLPVTAENFKGLSDPTRPPVVEQTQQQKRSGMTIKRRFVVESVLISPTRRVVVINGTSLGEGDFLNRLEVTTIEQDLVSVREGGEVFQLKPVAKLVLIKHSS